MNNIASFLYSWLISQPDAYYNLFLCQPGYGYGMTYLLVFLALASIATPLIYYFVLAKDSKYATKKDYISTWLLGYFVLAVMNYFGFMALVDGADIGIFTSLNLLKATLMDAVYYSVIYELVSYFAKSNKKTKARNIDLLSCWS